MAYDNNAYCNFSSPKARATAGKDILLAVYNNDGSKLLAISGQQGLTINRGAEAIEINTKDTQGGWKSKIVGMKEWSIDNDGIYSIDDESHAALSKAFDEGDPVCVKVVDMKRKRGMFGGLAVITDYPIEAPYDDNMTYSLTLEGMGALVDLLANPAEVDTMPQESGNLGTLTVVSVEGADEGKTNIYVNPVLTKNNKYKYKTAEGDIPYPTYNEDCTSYTDWDGKSEIQAENGHNILIVECTAEFKAVKAGKAVINSKVTSL